MGGGAWGAPPGTCDLIVDTASADHDVGVYMAALAVDGRAPRPGHRPCSPSQAAAQPARYSESIFRRAASPSRAASSLRVLSRGPTFDSESARSRLRLAEYLPFARSLHRMFGPPSSSETLSIPRATLLVLWCDLTVSQGSCASSGSPSRLSPSTRSRCARPARPL